MIKKLVKYGNSQALVLDKALLEILNISDTTQLKLSTDGTSLTITPVHESTDEKPTPSLSLTESEAEMHYGALMAEQQRDELKFVLENPERMQQMHKEFKETSDAFNKQYNYGQRMMELTSSPKYKADVKKIAVESYKKNLSLEEYNKAVSDFMQECMPDIPLKEFQESWKAFEKKYKATDYKNESSEHEALSKEMQAAADTQKKCQQAFSGILEQPELFQQMQWDYKEITEEFDKKYNYTQKLSKTVYSSLFKEGIEKLQKEVSAGTITPLEYSQAYQDLFQSFMPDVPMKEINAAYQELEKNYAALRNTQQQEAPEETKN